MERCAADISQLVDIGSHGAQPTHGRMPNRPLLAGATGTGNAVFTGSQLVFNGIAENAHESFCLSLDDGFGFCKTAEKPYDIFVKAALVIAQLSLDDNDDLQVSCDGSKMDWVQAMLLVSEIMGEIDPEDFAYTANIH